MWPSLNVTIFITHVRNCLKGATPIGGEFNVVYSLFVVAHIVSGFLRWVLFYGTILSVLYSSAIILLGNRARSVFMLSCVCLNYVSLP